MHMCIDIWCTVRGGFTLSIYKYNYWSGIWVYLLVLSTTMFIINVDWGWHQLDSSNELVT